MDFVSQFKKDIFNINPTNFDAKCLEAFHYQYLHNKVYQQFIHLVYGANYSPKNRHEIPFLPISFFKTHTVITGCNDFEKFFESSGTTGTSTSKHFVKDVVFYHLVTQNVFENLFFDLSNTIILPLLPSYTERSNSSLVSMVTNFMKINGQNSQDFYLYNFDDLNKKIVEYANLGKKIVVFGVTFALIDWALAAMPNDSAFIIIETGGMKGRKKEIIREEVHQMIQQKFKNATLASEYGMTELLSQGYAKDGHIFETPNWMQIVIRDASDPLLVNPNLQKGALNVIDLANIDSICFVETEDLAQKISQNTFKIIGRIDQSDVRGCNLMYT